MTPQIKQRIEQIRRGEVPEGYKRTRAGIIPSDWFLHPLTQHLTESRITGTNGAVAKKLTVKLWNKGVLEKREVHEGSESTTYYKRKAGQLIYSKLDFLNCAFGIIPQQLDGYESTQDLPCFDINGVDPCYLLTYLTQRNFYTHFGMIADGGRKARRIGPKDMLSFPLVYPPLSEQKKIAEILQTQGKLIELQQKKIEELKKLKKAYLSKMFPKKGCNVPEIRFPGFTDPWEQRKVSDMFKVTRGYVLAATLTNDTKSDEMPYPVYSSQTKDFGLMGYYRDYLYENSITWTTDGANAGTVNYRAGKFYCTNVCGVLLSDKVNASQMIAEALNNVAKGYVSYVGNPKLMNNVMSDIEIMIPVSPMEQKRISDYFATLDHLITLHQRKLEEMKKYKKSLMQLLLTGIVRM